MNKTLNEGEMEYGKYLFPYELKDERIRVKLPFDVNLSLLTDILKHEGYFVANDPEELDFQGWGKWYDAEGYYPFWVYKENGSFFFAFAPEDYNKALGSSGTVYKPKVGNDAVYEFNRWIPIIEKAKQKH